MYCFSQDLPFLSYTFRQLFQHSIISYYDFPSFNCHMLTKAVLGYRFNIPIPYLQY